MTSDEIKAILPANLSDSSWLKEIALQLALLREQRYTSVQAPLPLKPPHKPEGSS